MRFRIGQRFSPLAMMPAALAALLLAGCSTGRVFAPLRAPTHVRLIPIPDLSQGIGNLRFFFAEYLQDVGSTTRRVAVMVEPFEGPLRFVLDPRWYESGETGILSLEKMAGRFRNLRLHLVRGARGGRLGYAFLPEGARLQVSALKEGRYTLRLADR